MVRRSSRNKLAALSEQVLERPVDNDVPAVPRPNRVAARERASRDANGPDASSGPGGVVRQIDPDRLRLWMDHNRDYDALSESNCRDLIDSFRSNGQQLPAIGRPVPGEAGLDAELVVGARRLWTARYLGRPLLVETRALNDREAFVLMDLENRSRRDISDLERARDYRRALPKHFADNVSRMAESLSIDRGNFTKLLALADLPDEIVAAYGDERELRVHHGTVYAKLLREAGARKRMLGEARRLAGQGVEGKRVVKLLRTAAAAPAEARPTGSRPAAAKPRRLGNVSWTPLPKGRGHAVRFDVRADADADALGVLRRDIDAVIERLAESAKSE